MGKQLLLGDITVDVVLKKIKNIHLSVYPPAGRVRISAPSRSSMESLRLFAITKLGWIRQQQQRLREQERETPREYIDRESHWLWGKRYLLDVVENDGAPSVEVMHSKLLLRVRPGTKEERKQAILAHWYREQVRMEVSLLIAKWAPLMGVTVERVFVRQMRTRWGSCTPRAKAIRLNTELAKKPKECIEYVVVHELAHLLERSHNSRFVALMDRFMPRWKFYRDRLNRLPVGHEDWEY